MDMLKSIFALFAIVNPIGSIPIFLQLTNNMSLEQRQKTFRTGILASGIILFIFILAGPGAMITVLVTFSEHGFVTALVSIVVVLGITGLIFKFIDKIYGFLGKIVCTVLSKILCLFIAAIGIRLLMQGLSQYF